MWKNPTHERMQEVLHSPFDIETHKQTFVSYLEVVISPEGVVEYATPSHTDKLIEILAKQKGIKDFVSFSSPNRKDLIQNKKKRPSKT